MSNQMIDAKSGEVLPAELQQAISLMKEQLLIIFVNRLGGQVELPVSEIDDAGKFFMLMEWDQARKSFTFIVKKKD